MDLFKDYGRLADTQVNKSGLAYTKRKSFWDSTQVDTDDTIEFKRQLALQMYQNDYNSPSEQFNRLVSAGVSPFAAAQAITQVESASNASGIAGTGLAQEENQRANISMLSDLFQKSISFANDMINLVSNGTDTTFGLRSFDSRISNLHLQNDLLSEKYGISKNQNWLGVLQNAALSAASGFGGYNGIGSGFDLSGFTPEQLSGITDYYKRGYDSLFSKLRSDELGYKIENILPEILNKYKLDNSQKDYFMEVLNTLPPEVRAYLVLGMELYSTFLKPFDFGNFVPKNIKK